MPSDSGTSSLGHTGRPSMWKNSGPRKLSRLYTYTRLSIEQIQRVLTATVFGDGECPGKDSFNKKLSDNFDKEPRWLRPKTNTDMDRRFEQLANSPTRHRASSRAFNTAHSRAASSSISSHNTMDQLIEAEHHAGPTTHDTQFLNGAAQAQWLHSPTPLLPVTTHYVAFAARRDDGGPSLGTSAAPFNTAEGLLRRSTIMTNSTDMTFTTMKRVLAECPDTVAKQVNMLMKRFTIPMSTHDEAEDSPFDSRFESMEPDDQAWIGDEDEERLPDDSRPLPGDFLRLDLELQSEGCCLGEASPDHQTHSCYCDARRATTRDHWVSENGVSPWLLPVLSDGLKAVPDSSIRDPYGNTLLHLLAARDVPHQVLERAIYEATNLSATNSGGQTFLHLLGASWIRVPSLLIQLLQTLDREDFFDIYARDIYGRSIFHLLEDRIQDHDRPALERILRHFHRDGYYLRDAFGGLPGRGLQAPPLLRIDTALVTPSPQPAGEASEIENYSHQARMLEFIRKAQDDPTREDHKGRNALHCLANVILSKDTLIAQFGNLTGSSTDRPNLNSRKRKRFNTPYIKKGACDSSPARLDQRLKLVQGLLLAGVDPNHYAADGTTPLMAFITHLLEDGDYKLPPAILQELVDRGADVNARNRKGETALHVAARSGRKLAVRFLVTNGANVHARDAAGRSILDVLDAKVMGTRRDQKANAHYEACRAWISGKTGQAVQNPTLMQEWGCTEFRGGA